MFSYIQKMGFDFMRKLKTPQGTWSYTFSALPKKTSSSRGSRRDGKNLYTQVYLSISQAIWYHYSLTPHSEKKNRYLPPNKTSLLTDTEPLEVNKEYLVMCADKWQIAPSLTQLP